MNKQHVFDKFDIIRDFYNGKNTFTRAVLQWEIERKFVVLKINIGGNLRDREVACSTSRLPGWPGPTESPNHFLFVIAN